MTYMSAAEMVALLKEGAADGLNEAAELVQGKARERAPDDPSTSGDDLKESLTVQSATPDSLESSVYTDKDYAIYQHEALEIAHPVGQAKYLESAALDSVRDVEQIMAAVVRRRMG